MGILLPKGKTPPLLNYLHNRENALLQECSSSLASQNTSVPLTDDCLQAALLLSCTTFSASLWETRWHDLLLPPQNIWSYPTCSYSQLPPASSLTVGKLRWCNSPELLLQAALTCSCSLPCASWCLWGCTVSQGKDLPKPKDVGFSD